MNSNKKIKMKFALFPSRLPLLTFIHATCLFSPPEAFWRQAMRPGPKQGANSE